MSSMDTARRRQQMRYSRQVDDRASYTSSDRRQGPLPPIPRHHQHHQHRQQHHSNYNRPSSPSSMSSSPYTDDEAPMVRRHPPSRRSRSRSGSRMSEHHHHHHMSISGQPALMPLTSASYNMYGNETLRSSRSVPVLNVGGTWDGEPCPVHGMGPGSPPPPIVSLQQHPPQMATMRRSGSMFDIRSASPFYQPTQIGYYPPPPPSMVLERKPHHLPPMMPSMVPPMGPPVVPPPGYGMPPPHLLPPMMRPRQLVIPAGTEPVQPLPIRDPLKQAGRPPSAMQMLPKKTDEESGYEEVDGSFCKGHLIVLWIILGVVTLGVLLGIILGVIMG